jgi:DNA-directed RNA polymerase subunit F
MFEQLVNLGLTEKMAVKIIDLLPETEEDLKIIFYRVDVPENKDEILEVVSKFK